MRGLLAALVVSACWAESAEATCLSYASRVGLTGTLVRRVEPGPPNYTSIAGGDQPEIFWALRFKRPVCVDADPTDPAMPAMKGISEIQLAFSDPKQYAEHKDSVGKEDVAFSGYLGPAETGHHHTRVLLFKAEFGR